MLDALTREVAPASRNGAARARAVQKRLDAGLAGQGAAELGLLRTLRDALPRDGIAVWDMTISGYVAAPFFPVYEPDTWLYPLGSGTLVSPEKP